MMKLVELTMFGMPFKADPKKEKLKTLLSRKT
jgi:hypothetical protein